MSALRNNNYTKNNCLRIISFLTICQFYTYLGTSMRYVINTDNTTVYQLLGMQIVTRHS